MGAVFLVLHGWCSCVSSIIKVGRLFCVSILMCGLVGCGCKLGIDWSEGGAFLVGRSGRQVDR